jgi:hypothetical protein
VTQFTDSPSRLRILWNSQYFNSARFDDGSRISTVAPLHHIPNSFSGDRTMKTWYLQLSGYKLNVLKPLAGLQLKLHSDRSGRIIEDTVQFMYQNNFVGDNKANRDISQIKYFGGKDTWGFLPVNNTTSTLAILNSSTFAVAVRFQSHPEWPHRESPMVEYVAIRGIYETDIIDTRIKPLGVAWKNEEETSDRAGEDGLEQTKHTGSTRGAIGDVGLPSDRTDLNDPTGGAGYTGSTNLYIGSQGSNNGFTGSQGVPGVDVDPTPPPGYVGSVFSLIQTFVSFPTVASLPIVGSPGIGYMIQSDGSIRYWDPVYGGYLYLSRN